MKIVETVQFERVPFTMVPDSIVDDETLSCYAKLVYLVLRRHANFTTGEAFPSIPRIAQEMGRKPGKKPARISPKTVKAALRELVETGWILAQPRYDEKTKRHLSTLYTVRLTRGGGSATDPGVGTPGTQGGSARDSELHPPNDIHLNDTLTPSEPTYSRPAEEGKNGAYSPDFAAWFERYPRRVGKKRAFRKWKETRRAGVSVAELTQARDAYAKKVRGKSLEYVKHPAGFLTDDYWRDYLGGSAAALCPSCGQPLEYGHCYNARCSSQVPQEALA